MKVFIWNHIAELTDSYHSNGGLVVVANDLQHAIELAEHYGEDDDYNDGHRIKFTDDEKQPDNEYEIIGDVDPEVFVFPDAGCC